MYCRIPSGMTTTLEIESNSNLPVLYQSYSQSTPVTTLVSMPNKISNARERTAMAFLVPAQHPNFQPAHNIFIYLHFARGGSEVEIE